MQMFLFKMARMLTNLKMLANNDDNGGGEGVRDQNWYKEIIKPIADALNMALTPILILLGSAGAIYAIVLGVNLSRAESADKREEAKKRLINFVIGIVAAIILLILLKLLVQNIDLIVGLVTPSAEEE